MASVFKRGQKRWYGRIKVGDHWKIVRLPVVWSGPNAISSDKALYVAVESEMIANRATQMMSVENEAVSFVRKLTQISVAAPKIVVTAREFLLGTVQKTAHKVEAKTLESKVNVVKLFCDFLGTKADGPIHLALTKNNAQEFVIKMQQDDYATNSIKNMVVGLRYSCRQAISDGLIFANPFADVQYAGRASKAKKMFSEKEADSLMTQSTGIFRSLIALMLCTGLRVGDAVAMTWGMVNFDEDYIEFTPDKQRKGKETVLVVPLPAKLKRHLQSLPERPKEERITEGLSAARLKHPDYFKSQTKDMGIILESSHTCRHFYITMLAKAGVREEIRMKLVGHRSMNKVHSTYTHVELEFLRDEIKKVAWLS